MVRQVYSDVFRNKGLTSVVVSEGVEYIQPYAFADNAITSVTLPSTLTWMNTGAFANNNLASVDLPENPSNIGPGVFFDNALTSVTIPASVTTISAQAFNSNPGLSGITFEGNAPLLSQALALGPATTPIYFYADATGFTTPTWSGGGSTVYSPIEIVLVTVSFDANGHGTAPTSATVRPGNTVADPGALSATGYAFNGWFTAASGGTQITFPYTVTDDVTLYAQWERVAATVTAPAQAAAGSTITVTGENFIPGETVQVWLLSTPVQIGTATVGTDGTFTVNATVPESVQPGSHSIEVRGSVTSAVASPITITQVLATTGAQVSDMGWAALMLLIGGIGLLALGRRTVNLARLT